METGAILLVGCVSGFFCAALLGKGIYEGIHFAFLASRANEERQDALERGGAEENALSHRATLCPQRSAVARFLGSLSRARSMVGKDVFECGLFSEAARVGVRVRECGNLACGVVSFRGGGRVFYRTFFCGCVADPFVRVSCRCGLSFQGARSRARRFLRDQVPDALRCMEACLHAGLSLPQAFAEVAEEMEAPAKESVSRVSRDLDLGFSVEQSLSRFRDSSEIEELAFVAMALDVQYVCGGNAKPVLQSAEDSVARSLDLRRLLRVQTAQARFSRPRSSA